MKKLTLMNLATVFLIIVLLVFGFYLIVNKKEDKTFKNNLLVVDPAEVAKSIKPADGLLAVTANGKYVYPSGIVSFSLPADFIGEARGGVIYLCFVNSGKNCFNPQGKINSYLSMQVIKSSLDLSKWLEYRGYEATEDRLEDIKIANVAGKSVWYKQLNNYPIALRDAAVKIGDRIILFSVGYQEGDSYLDKFSELLSSVEIN